MNDLVLKEVWKDIKGFDGYYQVSNLGRVRSLVGWNGKEYVKREKIISQAKNDEGRLIVRLCKGKTYTMKKVHRLVAEAFIDNPNGYDVVNHIDSNPRNNDISNLEWCSQAYNLIHAWRFGNKTRIINLSEDQRIAELYMSGKSLKEIAELYNTSLTPIKQSLRRSGVLIRKRKDYKKYDIDIVELKRLFDMGIPNKDIAKAYGCPNSLIGRRKYQYKKGEI